MLNITEAKADSPQPFATQPSTTQSSTTKSHVAQAHAPQAGFGSGAFTCGGTGVGSRVNEMAAALALPRIRPAVGAASKGHAWAGIAGAAYQISLVTAVQMETQKYNQMTRINPVTPGGLGPHPVREPEPV